MSETFRNLDPSLGRTTLAELLAALTGGGNANAPTPPAATRPLPTEAPAPAPAPMDDSVPVVVDHDFFKVDPALNKRLKTAGLTDAQIQTVYDVAAERLVPIVRDLADRYRSARDLDRLIERFGGEERWREVARQIKAWAERNLPADAVGTLASSHDGVVAIHRMMTGGEPSVPRNGSVPAGASEDDLRALIRDPKYWRDRDPTVVARVTDGFRRLYPAG